MCSSRSDPCLPTQQWESVTRASQSNEVSKPGTSQSLANLPLDTEEVRIANLKLVPDHRADKLAHPSEKERTRGTGIVSTDLGRGVGQAYCSHPVLIHIEFFCTGHKRGYCSEHLEHEAAGPLVWLISATHLISPEKPERNSHVNDVVSSQSPNILYQLALPGAEA